MNDPLELRFPPDPRRLGWLRRCFRQKLQEIGVPSDIADNVVLVLDEIVTNSIEHSDNYRNADGRLLVRLTASGPDVVLEFEDPDVPKDVVHELAATIETWSNDRPPLDSERGRGLFLIAQNMDRLEVGPGPKGGLHLQGRFRDAIA